MPSDLEQLLEMGFEKERAEIAMKQTGSLNPALQWLEDNQDKSMEEITASTTTTKTTGEGDDEAPALKPGEVAKSMVCEDCGKKFRSMAQAEAHAERTEHTNFAESTEEIAPLTEEEKKQKLAELRAKAAERKSKQSAAEKEEQKRNEQIRMKATKEIQDIKEELAKKEQIKAAAAKRAEKVSDAAAKKRIQEKIAADKEERRLKAAAAKAAREGQAPPEVAAPAPVAAPAVKKDHTETRLRLQTAGGNIMKAFPVETTLFEVAQALQAEGVEAVESFTMTYPKKVFSGSLDFGKTLKEAGLVPSAVLIVK
ncbi:hypothetical protein BP6252_12239 [Coleophoma cylindrospora]|uniref:UBA domain-containing protein n=1 Tax=Coleophoma cylindrospora TaxID=1849047 RepID=A0A3D8QG77_9HELO|nr:hypothetical protein BP6252_12239 [Coleophoma cylindrospora]